MTICHSGCCQKRELCSLLSDYERNYCDFLFVGSATHPCPDSEDALSSKLYLTNITDRDLSGVYQKSDCLVVVTTAYGQDEFEKIAISVSKKIKIEEKVLVNIAKNTSAPIKLEKPLPMKVVQSVKGIS